MTFAPIGETIKEKAWRGPAKGVYLSLRVEKVLNELFPQLLPQVDNKAKMLSYREGKLTLLTPSSAISQEVYLHSTEFIKKLNESLGGRAVEEIKLKISN